ncbi:MAG TPA: pantetheine-phosphate adenylyltransferase [Bacillota bacterium]|nr:pantetheine-phosphate adenylyltransferase [Bacillota bacterium]
MKIAVYPGSFDPITNGHLDIIERAAAIFDQVIVAISVNSAKRPLFSMDERAELIKKAIQPYPNVKVDSFTGLTVEYVKNTGAQVIIRGLRAISDFESELQMAMVNKKLRPETETMFMMAKKDYSFLSSSIIKEVTQYGGCIKGFVPEIVEIKLIEKIKALKEKQS